MSRIVVIGGGVAGAELAMAIRLLSHLDREFSRVEARSWAEPHAERAMALGPNLLGHGLLNWSVRRLRALTVQTAVLEEAVQELRRGDRTRGSTADVLQVR